MGKQGYKGITYLHKSWKDGQCPHKAKLQDESDRKTSRPDNYPRASSVQTMSSAGGEPMVCSYTPGRRG